VSDVIGVRRQTAAAAEAIESVEHRKLHPRSRDRSASRRQRFATSSNFAAARAHAAERFPRADDTRPT